jgi:hypothetical protein
MNTAVMNAALMDQYIDLTMMTVGRCIALNVICKCQECIAHLVLYLKVADGVAKDERIYRYKLGLSECVACAVAYR